MMPPEASPKKTAFHNALVLLAIFFAFIMSARVSQSVFERLPHLEDEVAYLWQARLLTYGQTVIASPQPPHPFWQPFVVDYNGQRFGKYSLGWPALLAVGFALGQPWLINAWLSALTLALVYRLGREIFDPDSALIAALLTAFSPMALLLNGTLMGHTAALFTTTLFLYAYWRLEQGKQALRWSIVAGIALGLTIINRPLAGLALAVPFAAWSAVRLVRAAMTAERIAPTSERLKLVFTSLRPTLTSLVILSGLTLLITAAIPAYNYTAVGDSSQNLYLLVWSYDRVGFGEGYGRHGHTLEKGVRQTRWDLSLTAADIFGWETGSITPEAQEHILFQADYWPNVGLSWILLPFGLLLAFKRRWLWPAVWLGVGLLIFMQTTQLPARQLQDPNFAFLWMAGAALWLLLPLGATLLERFDHQINWTWLLLILPLALLVLHIAYWIGSQRYSTRYYFEGLTAFALLSALPLGWLARRWRWPLYGALGVVLLWSLVAYSIPRITPLYRFNWVSPELIRAVEARREGDRPVLVIVTGEPGQVKWRAYGSLTAISSPHLDSQIVVALNEAGAAERTAILAQFPDHQIIEMTGVGNYACFGDRLDGECYGEAPAPG